MTIRAAVMGHSPSTTPPVAVTVGSSPFTYQNTSAGSQSVIVSGGTVLTISYSRDGTTFYLIGTLAGSFTLNPGDMLRVTFAVAPTLTAVQIN